MTISLYKATRYNNLSADADYTFRESVIPTTIYTMDKGDRTPTHVYNG